MRSEFASNHFVDDKGRPAGGTTFGQGFAVGWQNGPLGRDGDRVEPNGAFVEDIIAVAHDRLEFYQNSGFMCGENQTAIEHLKSAIEVLNSRTARRESAGTEGTHKGS